MTEKIMLAHGAGGRLSRELIIKEIIPRFGNGPLKGLPDGAIIDVPGKKLVFSTDSFVVQPLEFPGGNIGDLAVHGTINDIVVSGGRPCWLSLGLILEEGLALPLLRKVLDSIRKAAGICNVTIATGDTKVVQHGQCDGMYINTSGIGVKTGSFDLGLHRIRPEDKILVSGNLGDHGMAVMTAREGINMDNNLISDTGSIHRLVRSLEKFGDGIRFMRDPTRGGAAAVLNEIVEDQEFGIIIHEKDIPVSPEAKALSEILGIDMLHVASEGRLILICADTVSQKILDCWREMPEGRNAAVIGKITGEKNRVVMETSIGGQRIVHLPQGELLPRIC